MSKGYATLLLYLSGRPPMSLEDDFVRLLTTPGVGDLVRREGAPERGLMMWPAPERLGEVETEVHELLKEARTPADFMYKEAEVWYRLRQSLFQLFWEGNPTPDQIRAAWSALRASAVAPVTDFEFVIGLVGLNLKTVVDVDHVRLGPLDRIVSERQLSLPSAPEKLAEQVFAHIKTQAPAANHALAEAQRDVEQALDLLVAGYPRLRFNHGDPTLIGLGVNYATKSGGENEGWGWAWRVQVRRVGTPTFEPADRLWMANPKDTRWLAPPFGWQAVQAPRLRDELRVAYGRIGRAVRRLGDPMDSLVNAVSGVESILSKRPSKLAVTLARVLVAWAAVSPTIPRPLGLANDYLARHAVLHEGEQLRWSEDRSREAIRRAYKLIDLFASLAATSGAADRADLVRRLFTASTVALVAHGLDREISQLHERIEASVTGHYRGRLKFSLDLLRGIRTALREESVAYRLTIPAVGETDEAVSRT